MKKPTLTVVDQSKPDPLAPPASLGEAGRKLWQDLLDFVLEDSGAHIMLLEICSAMDNLAEYDEEIRRDGVTIRTKSGVREHPLLKHRLAAQSFIVRSLHRLGLDIIPPRHEIGRPAGAYHADLASALGRRYVGGSTPKCKVMLIKVTSRIGPGLGVLPATA